MSQQQMIYTYNGEEYDIASYDNEQLKAKYLMLADVQNEISSLHRKLYILGISATGLNSEIQQELNLNEDGGE